MKLPRPRWHLRRLDDLLVAALLALLAFVLAAGEWLWRADWLVYDAALALGARKAPAEVVLVAIDDASVAAIGRWPWKRSVHATLLQRLAQARPRAVVLDLVLSEPDPDPRQDTLLAEALRAAAPVVMPLAWQAVPGEAARPLLPVAPLLDAVTLGVAEGTVDPDGVLRRAFLESGPAGRLQPHLGVALLRAGGEAPHPALAVEVDDAAPPAEGWQRQGRFLIRYGGPPGQVQRVSYVDVLRGAVAEEQLAGRYVLVGMTAQGLGDTLATPVNAEQRAMPGVEALAHTVHTLRHATAPRAVPLRTAAWASALAVLLLVGGFAGAGTRAALVLAVLAPPLAVAASVAALQAGWWMSPVPFALAAVLAYPLWSWRRLERGVRVLDREIARLDAEPGVLAPAPAAPRPPSRDRLDRRLAALHTASETLRAARRFLADALAGLPTAMLVDDGQGRVMLANPPAARLFEVESPLDLQGLDLPRLLGEFECQPPQDWPTVLTEVRRIGAAVGGLEQPAYAVQARMEGQAELLIHTHAVPMEDGVRLVVVLTDVTPLKQAERSREELLAFVSHDLRSPATSIVLLAEQHRRGQGTLDTDALLVEMQRLAQRTLTLSDDLVRVAQAALRPLQRRLVELAPLLDEVRADFAAQAAAAGVNVVLHAPGPADAGSFVLDRALLQRALGNLLSNAIRHAPAGSRVTLGVHVEAGRCCFEVEDHGQGLSAEAMHQLLQAHEGLVPQAARGVGFGLLFVQRVAQRHGGQLGVRPCEPGPGTVFELVLGAGSGNP